jgi:hypothetical protein
VLTVHNTQVLEFIMLPPDRAQTFANAPIDDLLGVLLRQMRRPLAAQGFTINDNDAVRVASERAAGDVPAETPALLVALAGVVNESLAVLRGLGLTFEQSLDADMTTIGGWQTTAEFLNIANEKSNAELRITLGAALTLAFGDAQFKPLLTYLAAGSYGDETVIAQRALQFAGKT